MLKALWRRFGREAAAARQQERVAKAMRVTTRENKPPVEPLHPLHWREV